MPQQKMECTKPAGHMTGSTRAYDLGCRCEDSREAKKVYYRKIYREKAYGLRPDDVYVSAAPIRQHVKKLRKRGYTIAKIGAQTGVGTSTLHRIDKGKRSQARQSTVDKVLAYNPGEKKGTRRNVIPAIGAARRLQALGRLGWTPWLLAERCGLSASTITRIRDLNATKNIYAKNDLIIRELYDDLWDQEPPRETRDQRSAVSHVLAHATRAGWLPPLAWDDGTIDDPNAKPATTLLRSAIDDAPTVEALIELLDQGLSLNEAALRAGYNSSSTAGRALYRAGRAVSEWRGPSSLAA